MNCKKGDLAVVVVGDGVGHIVSCIELHPHYLEPIWIIELLSGGRVRVCDHRNAPFERKPAGTRCAIADSSLRPLRDGDGEDEVLRLTGLPAGTPQAA